MTVRRVEAFFFFCENRLRSGSAPQGETSRPLANTTGGGGGGRRGERGGGGEERVSASRTYRHPWQASWSRLLAEGRCFVSPRSRSSPMDARLLNELDDADDVVDSADDEELDSDAAFDESDEERFAGFFSSKVTPL